jgi:uncharacterized membrane protein YgdD (TMEM256/DUF423 family)
LGSHALKATLVAHGRSDAWSTACLYHLIHAVALLALSASPGGNGSSAADRPTRWVAVLWAGGILAFSGSLYALALGGPRWFGPITPVGGVLFLAGWALVAFRSRPRNAP